MKHSINPPLEKTLNDNKQNTRVFARLISQPLAEEVLKEISGGETAFTCTYTRYPTADTIFSK